MKMYRGDFKIKNMIKILTGYSGSGGSTIALINLTNTLNKVGYPTIFYGPEDYHIKKCRYAKNISDYQEQFGERLIVHFGNFKKRPSDAKRVILCPHEKELYDINDQKCFWDECVFLNENHRKYHSNYTGPYRIIPNFRRKLKKIEKSSEAKKCAGVIGNIQPIKQTHISIQKAIDAGYEKVYLFGVLPDDEFHFSYYEKNINPLIKKYPNKIIKYGFIENQSEMYAMINAVYFFPLTDVASHIQYECEATNTILYGNDVAYYADNTWSNRKILNAWIDVLNLK